MSGHRNGKNDVEDGLKNWLLNAQKVVVAGIGNPLRKDDFVGVEIVRSLQDQVSPSVYLLECETVPESFLESIIEFKPTHILILDAARLNRKPGSSNLIEPSQMLKYPPISTHTLPLRVFCEYLAKTTNAKIALLLIQPEDTSFGEGLTQKIGETATTVTALLLGALP
ncbi:MAG: hydrogenase 3 maturation endopeptidase HyCI [Candidatus Bathyarchaeota archaeon]|nr:hydrogenase 3 maturation endopeptidase HyCI [Candidatus Bathyarchaeota archaeon]UCD26238.1 MAG: hydrogenase 3 maturation endopeptidase HyCI [Candidatus Bathyarchaeota archaeon]